VVLITLVTNALRLLRGKIFSQLYNPLESTHTSWPRGNSIILELSKRVAEYYQSKDPLFYCTIALRKSQQNRRVMSENQTIRHFSASLFAHDSKTMRQTNRNTGTELRPLETDVHTFYQPLNTNVNTSKLRPPTLMCL